MPEEVNFTGGARGKYYEHARHSMVERIARAIYDDDPVPRVAWEQLIPGEYRHARALRLAELAVAITWPVLR